MTHVRRPVDERFWEKVEKTDTCWLWRAGPHKDNLSIPGVFQLGRDGGTILASHYVWMSVGNLRPQFNHGEMICHTCDVSKCVRPDHLYLGTNNTNMRDMSQRCRSRGHKITHCPQGHSYDEYGFISSGGSRRCKICSRRIKHESYLRKKMKSQLERGDRW